jgi:hypothetical protein
MSEDYSPSLGTCCGCGNVLNVRTIVNVHKKSPTPGRGWGCVVCGLPFDGAVAVLCDECADKAEKGKKNIFKYACKGYPATDGRVPFESLKGDHDHDMSKHPEASGRN